MKMEQNLQTVSRWYCMASNGLATLCANEQDARTMAEDCDASWPKNAPHRAVLLGDVAAERERCAMICDKAAEMAWSRWEIMADQFDQGAAAEAEKLANAIREGQELEQRRESPAR